MGSMYEPHWKPVPLLDQSRTYWPGSHFPLAVVYWPQPFLHYLFLMCPYLSLSFSFEFLWFSSPGNLLIFRQNCCTTIWAKLRPTLHSTHLWNCTMGALKNSSTASKEQLVSWLQRVTWNVHCHRQTLKSEATARARFTSLPLRV